MLGCDCVMISSYVGQSWLHARCVTNLTERRYPCRDCCSMLQHAHAQHGFDGFGWHLRNSSFPCFLFGIPSRFRLIWRSTRVKSKKELPSKTGTKDACGNAATKTADGFSQLMRNLRAHHRAWLVQTGHWVEISLALNKKIWCL